MVHELRFEADWGLVREDLHVVIGDAAQKRTLRHVGQAINPCLYAAFARDIVAHILNCRVLDPDREIEEHAVPVEIGKLARLQILDRGECRITKQACPMIVRAHLHAAFIVTDLVFRDRAHAFGGIGRIAREFV